MKRWLGALAALLVFTIWAGGKHWSAGAVAAAETKTAAPNAACHMGTMFVNGKKKLVRRCPGAKQKPAVALSAPLGKVCDVALGPNGNLYVAGYPATGMAAGRIVEVSPSGVHLHQYLNNFPPDWGLGPCYTAVDATGNVYTAIYQGDQLVKFAPNGAVRATWHVTSPEGVTIDAHGDVYVAAFSLSKIEKFSPNGVLLETLGPNFHGHSMNTVEGLAFGPDGMLYAVNHRNSMIVKMRLDGTWVRQWGPHIDGLLTDLSRPGSIAVDAGGNMYLSDGDSPRAVEVSQGGKLVHVFDQTDDPQATGRIAVDAAGYTYAAERGVTKRSPDAKIVAVWH